MDMKKHLIVIFVGMVLSIASLFSEEGRKRKLVVTTSSFKPAKPEGTYGTLALDKVSLQEYKPKPYKLSDEKIESLMNRLNEGDGNAGWQLAKYYYSNDQIDEYIEYIKKGCDLLDPDCLYEIIDNRKNQIPCTENERKCYMSQLEELGKNGNEDAQDYWNLLKVSEKYRGRF